MNRSSEPARLSIVTYHYVRDLPNSRFPAIKGLHVDEFRRQVKRLSERFEMVSWDSFRAYLEGRYRPRRPLCQLHFDDGLRDHHEAVLPILAEAGIEGVFFLITRCLEESWVALAHRNHFLLAATDFASLERRLHETIDALAPETSLDFATEEARRVYRWDSAEVARYKFLVNYRLPPPVRESVLEALFRTTFPDEAGFARELYLGWPEVAELRSAGMVVGGHSHTHRALSTLPEAEQAADVRRCARVLDRRLGPGPHPFSYPYGRPDAFDAHTRRSVESAGFDCAFTMIAGTVEKGDDRFALHRFDTRQVDDLLDPAQRLPDRAR